MTAERHSSTSKSVFRRYGASIIVSISQQTADYRDRSTDTVNELMMMRFVLERYA